MNTILYPTVVFEGNPKETILDKAKEAVEVKPHHYGSPLKNHSRCAALWMAFLKNKGWYITLDAEEVCMMMILFKLCRYMEGKDLDSLVDIAGYARNMEMIQEELNGQQKTTPQKGMPEEESVPDQA